MVKFKILTRNHVFVDKLVIGAKDFDGTRIKLCRKSFLCHHYLRYV